VLINLKATGNGCGGERTQPEESPIKAHVVLADVCPPVGRIAVLLQDWALITRGVIIGRQKKNRQAINRRQRRSGDHVRCPGSDRDTQPTAQLLGLRKISTQRVASVFR